MKKYHLLWVLTISIIGQMIITTSGSTPSTANATMNIDVLFNSDSVYFSKEGLNDQTQWRDFIKRNDIQKVTLRTGDPSTLFYYSFIKKYLEKTGSSSTDLLKMHLVKITENGVYYSKQPYPGNPNVTVTYKLRSFGALDKVHLLEENAIVAYALVEIDEEEALTEKIVDITLENTKGTKLVTIKEFKCYPKANTFGDLLFSTLNRYENTIKMSRITGQLSLFFKNKDGKEQKVNNRYKGYFKLEEYSQYDPNFNIDEVVELIFIVQKDDADLVKKDELESSIVDSVTLTEVENTDQIKKNDVDSKKIVSEEPQKASTLEATKKDKLELKKIDNRKPKLTSNLNLAKKKSINPERTLGSGINMGGAMAIAVPLVSVGLGGYQWWRSSEEPNEL